MPFVLWTTDLRDGKAAKVGCVPSGKKAEVLRGIFALFVVTNARTKTGYVVKSAPKEGTRGFDRRIVLKTSAGAWEVRPRCQR